MIPYNEICEHILAISVPENPHIPTVVCRALVEAGWTLASQDLESSKIKPTPLLTEPNNPETLILKGH